MTPRNFDDERDRTVPPAEDYYGKARVDLNFNSRQSDAGGGINPVDEYNRTRGTNSYGAPAQNDLRYSGSAGTNARQSAAQKSAGAKQGKKKKKKKARAPKILTAVLAVVLVIAIACTATVESILAKINYDDKEDNAYVSASELYASSKVTNILLLGVDARSEDQDETSRADTMMLISFDREHGCIKLTSFLRDTWVYIPVADKMQRLNAACTYGGYSGVVDTIEYNFGIEIDGYIVADFEMFEVMVDSIGGVEIEVTEAEAAEVTNHPSRYGGVTLEAGTYTLTGEQALAYCRIRKIDSDWSRTERQRTVIQAIINGVVSGGAINALEAASSVAQYIETDLSKSELRKLIFTALACVSGGFEQTACPFDGTWSYATHGGASVIDIDLDENKEMLIDYIYNQDKSDDSDTDE